MGYVSVTWSVTQMMFPSVPTCAIRVQGSQDRISFHKHNSCKNGQVPSAGYGVINNTDQGELSSRLGLRRVPCGLAELLLALSCSEAELAPLGFG